MNDDIVRELRSRARLSGLAEPDLFDLLSAACLMCCTQIDGGNRTCPPDQKLSA